MAFAGCPVTTNSVTFLGTDTTTQGTWKGAANFNAPPASSTLTYGKEGNILPDTESCDLECNPFPAAASFGPDCINSATPGYTGTHPNSTHAYAYLVQGPANVMGPEPKNEGNTNYFQCNYSDINPTVPWAPMAPFPTAVDTREITKWYTCNGISSFYLELSFGESTHNFAVYVVDDMNGGTLARTEQLQVLDGGTDALLWDSGDFTNFSGGVYYKWAITGHVKIRVINRATNGRDAVINGVFFDPPNAAPLPVSISVWPASSNVSAGFSEQLIANVSNTQNTAVTWTIAPPVGSISASGVYTAPSNITSAQNVIVTATSTADATKSASATITLQPPVSGVSGSALVVSAGLGKVRNDYTGWVGFGFKVGLTPMIVSGLGRIAVAGNSQAHTVKLVDASADGPPPFFGRAGTDVPGGSALVMPGNAPPGTFAYAALGAPLTLAASKTYYVLTQETFGGDQWYDYNTFIQTSADATGMGPVYGTSSWTSTVAAGFTYAPVDVRYTLAQPPAPPSGTPLVTGMTLGTLRNDYSGWVGFALRIGPAPLVISGLGRIAVAGNMQNHTVKLVDATTGIDVPNGIASVAPAMAAPGTMAYAGLPAPVTLNANQTYYVVTQETFGGDRWYDYNSTLQTSAAGSVTSAVYGAAAPYVLNGSSGRSYGPVDLLYSSGTGSNPPVIVQQPQSATVQAGQTATFSTSVSSALALTYQWQSRPSGASGFTNIGGATLSSYTTPPTLLSDNGTQFQCVVSNSAGSVTTSAVTLNVQSSSGGGTGTAFVTGKVLGTLRNDYTGWVGMSITVGGNPLTVAALGRIFASGNSGTHALKIVNAATGADVAGGSATVTMTGSAGQFVYANLPSPIVLNANTGYYVLSQETAGGDRWYDYNTTATAAPVASLNGAVWGGGAPYTLVAGSTGHMYIPVDFLYGSGTVNNSPPVIGQQPQNASVTAGQTATFSTSASSTTALAYQWQSQPPGASRFTNIGGATASTYTTPAALLSDNGTQFQCLITNSSGSVTTNIATLSVQSSGGGGGDTSSAFVSSDVLGTQRNDYSGWVGMSITVSGSPLTVTALGRIFATGNSGTHTVKIINAATGADVPGGSVSITMTGPAGQFVYVNLPSPVVLNANTAYYVLSQETAGGDKWYDFNTTAKTAAVASLNGAVWGGAAPYVFVAGSTGRMYIPVDFKYTTVAPPAGGSSFVTSAHVGTKRNDFSGWAGMAIAVGSSPISVSSLGRMVAAGSISSHVVKLVSAAGVDIPGGSATVVTTGVTVGSFAYAPLASPVVLSANTTYYLVSQEAAGGDAWYDWDTTVQTNWPATVTGAAWAYTNSYSIVGGAGHTYIPLDFKF